MDYKQQILSQIKDMTYGEIMSELRRNIRLIIGSWDTVSNKNGKYYLYDYERKHSYKEEYGREIKGDELKKYLALKSLYDEFLFGRRDIQSSKSIVL